MDPIRLGGLVSGLDTESLIQKLMSIEGRPNMLRKAQIKLLEGQNTAWNDLNTKLLALKTSLTTLLDSKAFQGKSVSLTDSAYFSATVDTTAVQGSHSVWVQQMATNTIARSTAFMGRKVSLAAGPEVLLKDDFFKVAPQSGAFTLRYYDNPTAQFVTKQITYNADTDKLSDVLARINADTGGEVFASYDAATDKVSLAARNTLGGSDTNGIALGAGGDTGNFFEFTNLSTGSVGTETIGPDTFYKVTSGTHLAAVRPTEYLLGGPPTLTGTTGGTLTSGDQYGVRVVAHDASGNALAGSAEQGITIGGSDNAISASWGAVSGAAGYYLYVRDITLGEGQYERIDVGSVTSANITAHVAGAFNAVPTRTNLETEVTAGTFTINGVTLTVGTNDTMQSVIDQINASAAGVSASYDAANDVLTLSNRNTGNSSITYANGTSNFLTATKLTGAVQTVGNQAMVQVDGTTYYRNSNTISDILTGVTLSLIKAGPPDDPPGPPQETVTMSVSTDTGAASTAIGGFVSAFNAVEEFIDASMKSPSFDTTGKQKGKGGTLQGQSVLRSLRFDLQDVALSRVTGTSSVYDTLASIGITFTYESGKPLKMAIDQTALNAALGANPDAVSKLFNDDLGVATTFDDMLGPLTDATYTGSIPGLVESNNKLKSSLEAQIKAMEDRLKVREDTLRQKFKFMEMTLAKFQSQANVLTNFVSQLSSINSAIMGSKSG